MQRELKLIFNLYLTRQKEWVIQQGTNYANRSPSTQTAAYQPVQKKKLKISTQAN